MSKLTPVGSQNEVYPREDLSTEVHREIFDMNLHIAPTSVDEIRSLQTIGIVFDDESTTMMAPPQPVGNPFEANSRKRSQISEDEEEPQKRRQTNIKGVSKAQREEAKKHLLDVLNMLPAPETVPDLLLRTADRLEHNFFEKLAKERPVNALGRSSTLLVAGKAPDLRGKYQKEKDTVIQKVKTYVEIATREDADIKDVQQGEIWEVIRKVLDDADIRT